MRTRLFLGAVAGALALAGVGPWAAPGAAESAVADAAMRRDAAAVRALIGQGADVNAAQGDGMTALHWAAQHGDSDLAGVLLASGATVDKVTRLGGYTALHFSSQRGHASTVARLLDARANAEARTSTGVRPLHLAAQGGSAAAVAALLDRGADINAVDDTHGRTPIVFAASQNRLDAMRVLIARGADLQRATTVVDYLQRAQQDNQARMARERAAAAASGRGAAGPGGQAAIGGQAASAAAAGRGGRAGAVPDPNDPIDPFSQFARGRGDPSAPRPASDLEQIGRQGGFTALHYASRDGYADAAMLLLDAGLDVNVRTADLSTPMLVALVNGQYDLALAYLKRGGDANLASDDGVAPLFATINNEWALRTWYPQPTAGQQQRASYLEVMEALLKAGADPNARTRSHVWFAAYNAGRMGVDYSGATAFWRAAYALDVAAMKLLVTYGADPSIATMSFGSIRRGATDPSGLGAVPPGGPHVPPFHAASGVGYGTSRVAQQHRTVPDGWLTAARYFIEDLGVDINLRDAEGFTALHHAAARGDNKVIMYLVEKGANVLAVNRAGQTTVDMANSPEQRTQPFPETIKLLEGMGAKNNNNCRACK
jgi:ankyrin repeat protein